VSASRPSIGMRSRVSRSSSSPKPVLTVSVLSTARFPEAVGTRSALGQWSNASLARVRRFLGRIVHYDSTVDDCLIKPKGYRSTRNPSLFVEFIAWAEERLGKPVSLCGTIEANPVQFDERLDEGRSRSCG